MAVPSNLIAQALSDTEVRLSWSNSATDGTTYDIKRALSGGGLSTIATTGADATTYDDSGLSAGTLYDYQVCAHSTASCTSTVSVYTHTCTPVRGRTADTSAVASATDLQSLAQYVEDALNDGSSRDQYCQQCSVDGSVVFDCSTCQNFSVNMTEDINSIAMPNCDGGTDGYIEFVVPDGFQYYITGWPSGFGSTNGRPISLPPGSYGYPYSTGPSGPRAQQGAGGGSGAGPRAVALSLTCLTNSSSANASCSIACGSTKAMRFLASGGNPPYTFSTTAGTISGTGSTRTLSAAANTGSTEPGDAYMFAKYHQNCGGGESNSTHWRVFKCDDSISSSNNTTANNGCIASSPSCTVCTASCAGCPTTIAAQSHGGTPGFCAAAATIDISSGTRCDMRSGAMISAGCTPCGITMHGAVVTVTDSAGVSVSKTVTI